ncbi:cysteine synthase CysM [Parendozoicomonas sp. Alg238-R29]|uniref:cysteine synthase CysM n=1 Tax=Parendozoicomonas sp. Alg238-R29 TaxID=2993446 RepID=UPI00248E4880|nr:cysteine synthase CysM [Parendozoicomonas sp. Alg238-R29]
MIPKQKNDRGSLSYPTVESLVGHTPLVRLQRLATTDRNNVVLLKLEGQNPAGSVKDRPALSMIREAEHLGRIHPGDTLVEATSGNTGIALAMVAAIRGYPIKLIMPDNMSEERKAAMSAYGAELILVSKDEGMEGARDLALAMEQRGEGVVLDQFGNQHNPLAHTQGTGPEVWEQTQGQVTHFISSMGTTGTIMGTSSFLKQKNPDVEIIGLQPADGASIPGIRRWPEEYLPAIFDASKVDRIIDVEQQAAEQTMRALAKQEGIFCGVSSGGSVSAALAIDKVVKNATIVAIVCDRGDRYLSTGVFN